METKMNRLPDLIASGVFVVAVAGAMVVMFPEAYVALVCFTVAGLAFRFLARVTNP